MRDGEDFNGVSSECEGDTKRVWCLRDSGGRSRMLLLLRGERGVARLAHLVPLAFARRDEVCVPSRRIVSSLSPTASAHNESKLRMNGTHPG